MTSHDSSFLTTLIPEVNLHLYPPREQKIPSSTLGYVVFQSARLQNTLIVTILE